MKLANDYVPAFAVKERIAVAEHARRCAERLQDAMNRPEGAARRNCVRQARWFQAAASAEVRRLSGEDDMTKKLRFGVLLLESILFELDPPTSP